MAPVTNKVLLLMAIFVAAATGSSADSSDDDTVDGGFYSMSVTADSTMLLAKAMTANGDAGYASAVGSTRVCFSKVRSLEEQDVDGTNYRFHISGCSVSSTKKAGKCSSAAKKACRAKNYVVEVYEDWDGALQVTRIAKESTSLRKQSAGNAKVSAGAAN